MALAGPRRSNRGTRIVAAAFVAATVLLASACSTSNGYDQAKVAAYVRSSQKGTLRGLTEGAATCPPSITVTEGVTFTCTLVIGGVPAPYKVTLTDVHKSVEHIAVQPAKAILSVAALDAFVKQNLDSTSSGATVTCGPAGVKVLLAVKGQKISCALKLGSRTGTVGLTVKDSTGDVTITSSS